jgi:hypothetical protein
MGITSLLALLLDCTLFGHSSVDPAPVQIPLTPTPYLCCSEPGAVLTPIASKALARDRSVSPGFGGPVEAHVEARYRTMGAFMDVCMENAFMTSTDATDAAFLDVMTAARPPTRRLVGHEAYVIKALVSVLPDSVVELVQRGLMWAAGVPPTHVSVQQ